MNILIVNGNYNGGGSAAIAKNLFKYLSGKENVNVHLLVGKHSEKSDTFKVLCSNKFSAILHRIHTELNGGVCYSNRYAQRKVISYIKKNNIDIVHFHNIANNYFGIRDIEVISRYCKVVWTLHEMWSLTGHCGHPLGCEKWLKENCSRCEHKEIVPSIRYDCAKKALSVKKDVYSGNNITFVTPSKWLESQCRKTYLKNENIVTINNGVDVDIKVDDSDLLRLKYGFSKDEKIFMFMANDIWDEFKGLRYLIQAINNAQCEQFTLLIVGKGKIPKVKNKNVRVVCKGLIRDAKERDEVLAMSDVFILPSIAENFPTVCLESLVVETPILAFDNGGIGEIVSDNVGWLIKNQDTDALKNAIEIITRESMQIQERKANCSERVQTLFSKEKMVNEYIKLYENILGD